MEDNGYLYLYSKVTVFPTHMSFDPSDVVWVSRYDILFSGQRLLAGQYIEEQPNTNSWYCMLQPGGNLVVFGAGLMHWQTGTAGSDFVLNNYAHSGWLMLTGTPWHQMASPGAILKIENNGNLVLYNNWVPPGDITSSVAWARY